MRFYWHTLYNIYIQVWYVPTPNEASTTLLRLDDADDDFECDGECCGECDGLVWLCTAVADVDTIGGDAGLGEVADADTAAAAVCCERAGTCEGATNAFGPMLFLFAVQKQTKYM